MPTPTISTTPYLNLVIGGKEIGRNFMLTFEWKALMNGGYVIKARVHDPYFRILRESGMLQSFLSFARGYPLEAKFFLAWDGPDNHKTKPRIAFISDLDIYGPADSAIFEFVAIDPPTWLLNSGRGDGKVYTGNISKVIEQVVDEYAPTVTLEVTKTTDDPNGKWGMMRQDPRTFIQSLLEWSSSLSDRKTNWMQFSLDRRLILKQQHDLIPQFLAHYTVDFAQKKNDVLDWNSLMEPYVSGLLNRAITQGISTVSGKFLDPQTEKDKTEIKDDNTGNKRNVKTDHRLAFTKSNLDKSTSFKAIPELSGGEIGIKYEDWIDGRARNSYLNMLQMPMAMRLQVIGDHRIDDPTKLGLGHIYLEWKDTNSEDFFLSGRWLVSGFHHVMTSDSWFTNLYVYRMDHDASAIPIGAPLPVGSIFGT